MDLKTYTAKLTPEQRRGFADRAGTNLAYLSQLIHGHRRASPTLARRLREASGNQIDLCALRPDVWTGSAA